MLDEIGELPLSLQPKLLRALETRRARRLGGTQEYSFDFRLVSATHRDLEKSMEEGTFRQDLYYTPLLAWSLSSRHLETVQKTLSC